MSKFSARVEGRKCEKARRLVLNSSKSSAAHLLGILNSIIFWCTLRAQTFRKKVRKGAPVGLKVVKVVRGSFSRHS